MLKKTLCLVAFAGALLPGAVSWSQVAGDVVVERNVAMKTRDGVTLFADVYRPAGDESLPVLAEANSVRQERPTTCFGRMGGVCAATSW